MKSWEYTVFYFKFDNASDTDELMDMLKNYGSNGWELISIVPMYYDINPSGEYQHEYQYTFKREIKS